MIPHGGAETRSGLRPQPRSLTRSAESVCISPSRAMADPKRTDSEATANRYRRTLIDRTHLRLAERVAYIAADWRSEKAGLWTNSEFLNGTEGKQGNEGGVPVCRNGGLGAREWLVAGGYWLMANSQ